MPIDPNRVDRVARTVADIYRDAEATLTRIITARLARGLDTPDWAVRRRADIHAVRRAATLVADHVEQRTNRAARRAVTIGYRAGNNTATVDLAETLAGDVGPRARAAPLRRGSAVQALADALVHELEPVTAAILPSATSAYRRAIGDATGRTLTGAVDLRTAAQQAWAALVSRGITGYVDSRGRRWELASYVEMATRTAVQRAAVQGQIDAYTTAGHRLVYVPDRPRECELCRPWEARVLALWGRTGRQAVTNERTGAKTIVNVTATVEQARIEGLLHPSCRHELRPYSPGRTTLRPGRAADPDGYAAEQRQRAIERHLRRWRLRETAALTTEGRSFARARVAAWETAMRDHLAANPRLTRARFREQPGAGFTPTP